MQTVLVTGANGFVGAYLVKELLQHHFLVIATGRNENHLVINHPAFRWQVLDFTNKEEIASVFSTLRPDVVVHSGAMSKPDDCELNKDAAWLTNVTGTTYLLEEAAKLKAHFIFLSTDFVFSGEKGMYKEEDERSPVNYYGQTKVQAEDVVSTYEFDWTIVRTVLVYGKSLVEKQSFIEVIANSIKNGKELKIFNDQVRTPTYVEDLAKGITAVIQKKATGVFHLSGSDAVTVYEAAIKTAEVNQLDTKLITPIKEGDLQAPAKRPKITGFTISKAHKKLGYEPVSFMEGLQKTFAVNAYL
jgi:dTDP-4-dehydrorhamnose reductase